MGDEVDGCDESLTQPKGAMLEEVLDDQVNDYSMIFKFWEWFGGGLNHSLT